MKKIFLLAACVLFLVGCERVPVGTSITNTQSGRMIGVYVDEQPNNPKNLKEIKIATITVAPDGNLKLNILQNDAFNIKRLQEAMAAIVARPGLKLVGESEEIINGYKALVMKDFAVLKTDSNYPFAVAETLTMEFGLKAQVEKETSSIFR